MKFLFFGIQKKKGIFFADTQCQVFSKIETEAKKGKLENKLPVSEKRQTVQSYCIFSLVSFLKI